MMRNERAQLGDNWKQTKSSDPRYQERSKVLGRQVGDKQKICIRPKAPRDKKIGREPGGK